jgi:hypothetical protein
VDTQRGSAGAMNLTSGRRREEASSAVEPLLCTKTFRLASQKCVKTSW